MVAFQIVAQTSLFPSLLSPLRKDEEMAGVSVNHVRTLRGVEEADDDGDNEEDGEAEEEVEEDEPEHDASAVEFLVSFLRKRWPRKTRWIFVAAAVCSESVARTAEEEDETEGTEEGEEAEDDAEASEEEEDEGVCTKERKSLKHDGNRRRNASDLVLRFVHLSRIC